MEAVRVPELQSSSSSASLPPLPFSPQRDAGSRSHLASALAISRGEVGGRRRRRGRGY